MTVLRTQLYQEIFDTPLMMHPGKAKAAMLALGGRIVDGGVEFGDDGIAAVDHWTDTRAGVLSNRLGRSYDREGLVPFDIIESVGVIPIEGTLVHKGGYIGQSSGESSYQGLQAQIAHATKSDRVRAVAFEVDSYGGQVDGAFQTADMIRRLSAVKPTIAILTDNALSAGYLLASQARQIVMPSHGKCGSVGVITMHADLSGQLEQSGVKVTILSAGERKPDGNPYEPLDEAFVEKKRAELNGTRQSFAEAVGLGRKSKMSVASILKTEGSYFEGNEAVDLGLADAVGNPNDAFAEFVAAVNRAR